MNLENIKEKLSGIKNKAVDVANLALEKSSITLKNSNLNISNLERFELFINKSENYYNEVVKKEYSRNVIVIFASKDSDFYKKALYIFPVVFTKAWSANIEFKLVDSSIEGLDLKKYNVESLPSLVLFENKEVKKVVAGEEKINKIVKNLSLDIIKSVMTS